MDDQKREIARKYMLPERPFLHGMASAFDMFGALNEGKSEQVLRNLQDDLRALEKKRARSVWQDIGESLYQAIKEYENANGEIDRQ